MNELEKNLQTAIDRGNAAVDAQYELMRSGSRDVEIENNETVPSIDKRLEGMVGAVTSINGQTGAVDIGFESLGLGSAARWDVSDLQAEINKGSLKSVASTSDLTNSPKFKTGDILVTKEYHFGSGIGGATYVYDESVSYINNGITIIKGWRLQWDGVNLSLLQAGCYADGVKNDGQKILDCLNIISEKGGYLRGYGFNFLNNTVNYEINSDNVWMLDINFKRAVFKAGWMIRTATTKEINGGGFINVTGSGNNTDAGGAFLNLGTNDFKHNKWIASNIRADGWSQYGVGINGGDDWLADGITVTNHGLPSGVIDSCMGFYVFPRNAGGSKGGRLSNVYSEMSAAAIANTQCNSAAIKLQAHAQATFINITAIGGYEQCLGIDSIDGTLRDLKVYPQGERVGLFLGNYNAAHNASGQKFIVDGVTVIDAIGSSGTYAAIIGGGEDGQYKLSGCTIRNLKARRFKSMARTAFKDCVFENITCEDIRLSTTYQSLSENSVKSTGNTFNNVRATVNVLAIQTDASEINNCGNGVSLTTTGFQVIGNSNIIRNAYCSSSVSALAIRPSSTGNIIVNPVLNGSVNAVQFQATTSGNIVYNPIYLNKSVIANLGDSTNLVKSPTYA